MLLLAMGNKIMLIHLIFPVAARSVEEQQVSAMGAGLPVIQRKLTSIR